jgi:hypothetical protein
MKRRGETGLHVCLPEGYYRAVGDGGGQFRERCWMLDWAAYMKKKRRKKRPQIAKRSKTNKGGDGDENNQVDLHETSRGK